MVMVFNLTFKNIVAISFIGGEKTGVPGENH
jgi:hypothetical protein